eukprot:scaffold19452_cov150-Skeletonema_menzelii.AAC.1
MIKQALTKPRGTSNIIGYSTILGTESEHFLHISYDRDGLKLGCSKSANGNYLSDSEQELSPNTEAVYKDAAEGGWPEMIQQLIAFLQRRKAESLKKNKKRGRKKLGPKASNNVTQTSNSARPLTPADAATRPAPASTPSTKSPTPKRGRTSTDPPVLRAVSTDDDTPTNRSINNTAYDFKAMLYDDNGCLREEIVAILRDDKHYAIIDRHTSRDVRVSAAARVIAPRFEGDPKTWTSSANSSSTASNTMTSDANQLQEILAAITNGNSERAADAITRMLGREECRAIKGKVKKKLSNEEPNLSSIIIDGINEAISHHTNPKGGTRTLVAEAFVKDIVLACVWGTVGGEGEDISNSILSGIIGTTKKQVDMARNTARDIRAGISELTALQRNRRKDFIRDALLQFLYQWIKDDKVSRFDSNQSHVTIVDPCDESKEISEHKRIWLLLGSEHRHEEFIKSSYYEAFQEENPGATVGITVFSEALKKFRKLVSDPKPESCVDEKVSGLENAMDALYRVLISPDVKQILQHYEPNEGETSLDDLLGVLQRRSSHQMVELVCCRKEEQPDLHIDKSTECPQMIPFRCTHGKNTKVTLRVGNKRYKRECVANTACECCGIGKRLGNILEMLEEVDDLVANKEIEVSVWCEARRQGKTKKGKNNTQRELQTKIMTVVELIDHFEELLEICIPHIQEIRWIKLLQDIDFTKMPPDTIIIFTDFAAVMALRAREAKNSSVDAHAICCNQVVLWNKRVVKVSGKRKGEDGEEVDIEEEITISNCDYIHFFAETFEPGKKNDHSMHNTGLDDTIETYRAKLRELGIELKRVIIWTDNAPHQYRCRQTFIQVASVELRHPGIEVVHCLAIVDNFKGIHDAIGKEPSRLVKDLEKIGIRSPNALAVFVNCILHLETTETEWDRCEAAGSIKLKKKGKYGMNSRVMKFVVEDREEYNRLAPQYPGRILLCDRSVIQDTIGEQPIEGTTELHEVRTIEPRIPTTVTKKGKQIRNWRVLASDLPCNCVHCNNVESMIQANRVIGLDPIVVANAQCKYANWRNTRIVTMKNFLSLEPTSAISQSAAEYNSSRALAVQVEATVESLIQRVVGRNGGGRSQEEEDTLSIELFALLPLNDRARVMRLLQWETTSTYDLSYGSSAYRVQHASLKRLATGQWLNDEVINGFIVHYLRPKQNERSHVFLTHFMSKLLNTGEHGTDTPNYRYENVRGWSRSIPGGLFEQRRIFVPINRQNVHWLTLCINMPERGSLFGTRLERTMRMRCTPPIC